MLGFPGNPVSSLVCGLIFLVPAIRVMLGLRDAGISVRETASLGRDLGENDQREDYLRATLSIDDAGRLVATPFEKQDSSMLSLLAQSDCLIVRPPHAPPAKAGDPVEIIPLGVGQTQI